MQSNESQSISYINLTIWTEYFVVNILIFIVLYLLVFLVDWGAKRLIKKYA